MRVIAIVNHKGGVGKTTTAEAITSYLALKGKKVLAIDTDGQGNLSATMGADMNKPNILGVLTRQIKVKDAIQKTASGDVVPADKLSIGSVEDHLLQTKTGREFRVKETIIEPLKNEYDYVVIDTPPADSILLLNALVCANWVVIPAEADIYSLDGIETIKEDIDGVQNYYNQNLEVKGILLTRYNSRSNVTKQITEVAEAQARKIGTKVFKTHIRENVAVKEAHLLQQSIFEYAPKSNGATDYKAFIEELIKK